MKLVTRKLKSLKPAPYNPRQTLQPGEHEYEAIKASLTEFGLIQPLVVNKASGFLVGGHQRRQVMMAEGMTECQVVEVDLDEAAERRLNLQLNGTGRWDEAKLGTLLAEMQQQSIDLATLGFSKDHIADLLTKAKPKPKADPDAPAPPATIAQTKAGDIYELWTGDSPNHHRIICGDSTNPMHMARLMDGRKARLVFIDPPYGVSYTAGDNARPGSERYQGAIANDDLRAESLQEFLTAAFERLHEQTIDEAAIYCFYASCNHIEFENALRQAGWRAKQQLIWAKQMVLSRSDYHWAHEPCQPAGTLVRKVINPRATSKGRQGAFSTTEDVPIETLKSGDTVVSYEPRGCVVHTRGRKIKTAQRKYYGDMIEIAVDGKRTKATDAHQFTVRLDESKSASQVVYLMRKGNWWRIGQVRLFNSRGFGLASRLADEGGDEAWILRTAESTLEALVIEQALSCKYSIPTTHWNLDRYSPNPELRRAQADINRIYEIIGVERIQIGAAQAITDHHRNALYPIVRRGEKFAFSRKMSRTVRACNLIPGLMQVPIPTTGEGFKWETILDATYTPFAGTVYSLDVDRDQHYIADGIITHNCLYGAKAGHNCEWLGDRTEITLLGAPPDLDKLTKDQTQALLTEILQNTTYWTEKRDSAPSLIHPTQKPTSLARRALRNSSLPGEIILDSFGGSGSTLIAAELEGRTAYLSELDPCYVDAAVKRFGDTFEDAHASLNGKQYE